MPDRIETNVRVISLDLKPNHNFPNSNLPVLVYKGALNLPRQKNRAAGIIQQIFLRNGWSNSWRNGIYEFHHYHSNTHECMAVAMGSANVILGGPGGRKVVLEAGDVIILPAGTGHKRTIASEDFLCVGAYPQGKDYDTNRGTAEELEKAKRNIEALSIPAKDPVFGKEGFIRSFWRH